jgi:NAD(P)-dependent dehydrogenase (short-subunit alcohol dehydrogenase family)
MTSFEVHVAARAIAKKAVVQELREAGVRVTLVFPAEINQRATAYIASHPDIWPLAQERARKIEEAEKARKARRRKVRR